MQKREVERDIERLNNRAGKREEMESEKNPNNMEREA